jgi:hypothetical protein
MSEPTLAKISVMQPNNNAISPAKKPAARKRAEHQRRRASLDNYPPVTDAKFIRFQRAKIKPTPTRKKTGITEESGLKSFIFEKRIL